MSEKLLIQGHVQPNFQKVADAFTLNFDVHSEIGASVCIYVDGEVVVDLHGGFADPAKTRHWKPDQLVNAFSVGKGVTSVVAAQCVARNIFTYDTKVADIWPEFECHGKGTVTVRDILGHRAGLPAIRQRMPKDSMMNWQMMTQALATETPWWTPGTSHGYHVNTFGFLIGEIILRATGQTVGQLIQRDISTPLHADIYLGSPKILHSRMADFEWPSDPMPEEEPQGLTEQELMQANTYSNPSGLSGAGVVNSEQWRSAEMPSTNLHASARGVALLYNHLAYGGTHGGVSLLPNSVLEEAVEQVSLGEDIVLGRRSRFAHGFQIPLPERGFGPNERAFGHYGAGGSVGFCDPTQRVGFGYVMNQMGPRWQNPRNKGLIEALYNCL